jgi:hypothetical protein
MSGQPVGYNIDEQVATAKAGLNELRAKRAAKEAARLARAEQWDALLAVAVDHPQGRGGCRRMLSRP